MSELTELPEWVWNLLDAVAAYEEEHPILYRLDDNPTDGSLEYVRASCFGSYLTDREAWPPREMQDAAEFRRHLLRETTPPTTQEEA